MDRLHHLHPEEPLCLQNKDHDQQVDCGQSLEVLSTFQTRVLPLSASVHYQYNQSTVLQVAFPKIAMTESLFSRQEKYASYPHENEELCLSI